MYNKAKSGINQYRQMTAHSKSVCEQTAFLFEQIGKIVINSENAYALKDYSKGAELSMKAIDIATALSSILMPENEIQEAQMDASGENWNEYFADLIQTIARIGSSHNKILTEKLIKSLGDMATMWRNQARKLDTPAVTQIRPEQMTRPEGLSFDA